jgi:hypothetical protein
MTARPNPRSARIGFGEEDHQCGEALGCAEPLAMVGQWATGRLAWP